MKMNRICEILNKFKHSCKNRGWKTSENEDWIKIDDTYHNFLWAKNVSPTSFKRIVSNAKCVVFEGLSYNVVKSSYMAWLFSETLSEPLIRTMLENPDFSKRVALYDLSPLLEGKNFCIKLNDTDSSVFQEFESYLKKDLKVRLKLLSGKRSDKEHLQIAEMA